jgi:hypothetical protein
MINDLSAIFLNHASKFCTRKLDEFMIFLRRKTSMETYFALYSNSIKKGKFKISFSHIAVGKFSALFIH